MPGKQPGILRLTVRGVVGPRGDGVEIKRWRGLSRRREIKKENVLLRLVRFWHQRPGTQHLREDTLNQAMTPINKAQDRPATLLPRPDTTPAGVKIIYTFISLLAVLLLIRGNIVDLEWRSAPSLITYFPKALLAAFYDFWFVLGLTIFFGMLLWIFRSKPTWKRNVYYGYVLAALLVVIAAVLNERTIRIIGSPFNYQWLYYSDFMGSADSKNAMLANISWNLAGGIIVLCFALLFLSGLLTSFHRYLTGGRLANSIRPKAAFLTLAIFLICYSVAFNWYRSYRGWQYNELANPITFFVESVVKTDKSNLLFSMEVPGKFEDLPVSRGLPLIPASSGPARIRNVVFFILESVPAKYMDQYGGEYNVTPEINKLIPHSIRFTNAYAHSPATNNSMVSIMGSIYPWISYKSLTREYPDIKLNSISSLLKQSGYRTAFYNSGDLKYQRANEFLLHQGFDQVEDFSSAHCRDRQFIVKGKRWENPDGSDDDCMVDAFSEWIDKGKEQPFFATLWSVQTHYPYFYSGKEKDYKVHSSDFNRYLNALQHTDATLGKLMTTLRERQLDESTLVVIVGDHGEAFGQHEQYTHASKIYEENVHVPLILVNKNLFKGETNNIISGHIDIAPTVMSLLQLPAGEQWQGQNLFTAKENKRTYFFAPWSDFLFGYREGDHKFIYNATKNITEVYDLAADPAEMKNIADQFPAEYTDKGQKRLAQWIQYQDKFIRTAVKK